MRDWSPRRGEQACAAGCPFRRCYFRALRRDSMTEPGRLAEATGSTTRLALLVAFVCDEAASRKLAEQVDRARVVDAQFALQQRGTGAPRAGHELDRVLDQALVDSGREQLLLASGNTIRRLFGRACLGRGRLAKDRWHVHARNRHERLLA